MHFHYYAESYSFFSRPVGLPCFSIAPKSLRNSTGKWIPLPSVYSRAVLFTDGEFLLHCWHRHLVPSTPRAEFAKCLRIEQARPNELFAKSTWRHRLGPALTSLIPLEALLKCKLAMTLLRLVSFYWYKTTAERVTREWVINQAKRSNRHYRNTNEGLLSSSVHCDSVY